MLNRYLKLIEINQIYQCELKEIKIDCQCSTLSDAAVLMVALSKGPQKHKPEIRGKELRSYLAVVFRKVGPSMLFGKPTQNKVYCRSSYQTCSNAPVSHESGKFRAKQNAAVSRCKIIDLSNLARP